MFKTKYPKMPIVDMHCHFGRRLTDDGFAMVLGLRKAVADKCGSDMALWIDLDGGIQKNWNQDVPGGLARINRLGQGRIIGTLADYRPAQSLKAATPDQLVSLKEKGFCGWKWHWQAAFNGGRNAPHGLLDDPYFTPYYAAMEAAGMPLVALHVEAPWGDSNAQRNSLRRVMDRYPDLTVIHAHFGIQRWPGLLAEQAKMFDEHPNYYRDISVTAQHAAYLWTAKELREFFTQYADRLLYGTDLITSHRAGDKLIPERAVTKYALQFEWLETANRIPTKGIGKLQQRSPEFMDGMNLPVEVLEKIYWKNAARLIPHVREALIDLGYILAVEPKPSEVTWRAKRLLEFLPKVQPADIASMSTDQLSAVKIECNRLNIN